MTELSARASNDPAFHRFVDALDDYLQVSFGCARSPVERPVSGRCVFARGDAFSVYLRYQSGLYDLVYDRPVTLAKLDCTESHLQCEGLLRFLVDHADEHDLGAVILECADDELSREAPLLGFRPCGIHFRNWHASIQTLRLALSDARCA